MFALNSLLIFLLLLPGISFRFGYLTSHYSIKTLTKTDIPTSIIPALLIHFLSLIIFEFFLNINSCCNEKYDLFNIVYNSFSNIQPSLFSIHVKAVIFYIITLIIIGYSLGHLFRIGIKKS